MIFKYAVEIAKVEDCPPSNVVPCAMEAFRFVHENIADERNFKCVAKLHPTRKLRPEQRCSGLGLSMFVSKEKAIMRYRSLVCSHKNIGKSIGNKLAVGRIEPDDGRMSQPNSDGHFDLWESEETHFITRFRIVVELLT